MRHLRSNPVNLAGLWWPCRTMLHCLFRHKQLLLLFSIERLLTYHWLSSWAATCSH
jgi:hypothetical protein